jgi:hypothetical protein
MAGMQRKARRRRDAQGLARRRNTAMRPAIPRPCGLAPACGARFVARLGKGFTLAVAALRAIIRMTEPTQPRFILLGVLSRSSGSLPQAGRPLVFRPFNGDVTRAAYSLCIRTREAS